MEARRDVVKTFAALATLGLVAVGVAAATVLHIWFKYDSPEELREPSTLRQKPLDDDDRD
jgi:hypothetical protein